MKKTAIVLFTILVSCTHNSQRDEVNEGGGEDPELILDDRHVHIMSPQLIELWKNMGIPFSKEDSYYSNIDTIFKQTGAHHISLISMAYVYSSGEFGGNTKDVEAKIQEENNYLATAKSRYPDRIKAYFGIDPLQKGALAELSRCHRELKLDGIKLHYNASQVYLTEAGHRSKVRQVFTYASDNQLPVLMHFDNAHPKFGREDVLILADSVLTGLDHVDLQIAHFGTSGGFDQKTRDVLDTFIELFQNNHAISGHHITFDISAVALDKDTDGVKKLTDEAFDELAAYCRKLGFDKIVFGTDYPLYTATEYFSLLKTRLNLTGSETQELLREK